MDEVVQSYVQDKTFMGAVLVARGSDVILSKGYGSANLEWDIPNTPTTKFRLGSITKQFTAASILLLEERGKLRLDDPIKKHVPDAPAAWDTITIFNLLTHTSGIREFHQPAGLQIAEAGGNASREDDRDRARQAPRFRARRENELQQLRLSRARLRHRAGYRRQLREVRDRQHLHAAWHEGLRVRLEHRHHPAPGRRIHAVGHRSGQRRLRAHEHPARGRRALLHNRGSASLGAGPVRRQADFGHLAREDDDTVQGRLRARGCRADRRRSTSDSARRRHRRVQHVPGVLPR